jgi:hypothetical protein
LLQDKHSPSTSDAFSMAYQLESYLEADNHVAENEENAEGPYDREHLEGQMDHVYQDTSDAINITPHP